MLIGLIFLLLFVLVAVLLFALTAARAAESKQTAARLEAIRAAVQGGGDETFTVRRQDVLSGLSWLDRLLRRIDLAPRLRLLLSQADLSWTVGRFTLTVLVVALATGVACYLRTGSGFFSVLLGAIGAAAPVLYVVHKRTERFDRMKERLPEALDYIVAAIRVGHSFTSAMGLASKQAQEPVRTEFRQCFDEQNYGLDLRAAMTNLVRRTPIREVRMITTAVLIQKETGGNLTEVLEKVAGLIRDDFRLQRQINVHTAQGRLTGWILSILPFVLGVALFLLNPEHMSILWERPIGLRLLYGAAILTIVGMLIIRRIIRIEI